MERNIVKLVGDMIDALRKTFATLNLTVSTVDVSLHPVEDDVFNEAIFHIAVGGISFEEADRIMNALGELYEGDAAFIVFPK